VPAAEPAPGYSDVLRIVAPNPGPMTLAGTNTYLVGERPAYVIDPGPADPGHAEAIATAAASKGGVGGVLLTHSHGDHADGARLIEAPLLPPEAAAEAGLVSLPTPGHAADHVCYLRGGLCFSGDLVLGEGSSYVPPDGGSLAAYLDSLGRLRQHELDLIAPGHGPWIRDPAAKLDQYLEHRLERERKLLAALEAGERSRARLLELAWDDVPPELRGAAAMVMEAHLQKLAAEELLPDDLVD
jgi:glyoxylase-like metal-dependent hydrolase (beta-lactamase superfamily II)